MKALLLGDVSPTAATNPLFASGDAATLFHDVLPLFAGNDINFINLECAITESDHAIAKFGPNLKAVPNTARVLREIGVNYCGLSNNHIFDFGIPGATDTLRYLEEAGITYTGFGSNYDDSRKDLVIRKGDETVAIITVCEHEYSYALEDRMGSRPFCEFDTPLDIRAAKEKYDRVIVIYHGGKEHCGYPSPRLMKACRTMAKSGADVILCQHSHCIGCYEQFEGCHILYGQGNFHFVKPEGIAMPESWNSSLAVSYDTVTNEITFTPLVNVTDGIALAKGDEKEQIMAGFEKRSADLANGQWKEGWHTFCLSMRDAYIDVLANTCKRDSTERQNAHFGHYLDCEAHTDVWRELFPTYNQTNEK